MTSGVETTGMILTSHQTHSAQSNATFTIKIVLPCCSRSANQIRTERCLEVTALSWLSNVSWAV